MLNVVWEVDGGSPLILFCLTGVGKSLLELLSWLQYSVLWLGIRMIGMGTCMSIAT